MTIDFDQGAQAQFVASHAPRAATEPDIPRCLKNCSEASEALSVKATMPSNDSKTPKLLYRPGPWFTEPTLWAWPTLPWCALQGLIRHELSESEYTLLQLTLLMMLMVAAYWVLRRRSRNGTLIQVTSSTYSEAEVHHRIGVSLIGGAGLALCLAGLFIPEQPLLVLFGAGLVPPAMVIETFLDRSRAKKIFHAYDAGQPR